MRTFAALAALFLLCGCTALMVGGAGVAGYQLGKDERPPAVVTADAAITAKVKGKYVADSVVSAFNINVDTYAGRVTLRGTVGSLAARNQAVALARGTDGVRSVDDQITIEDRSN